jgi:hypothetical protein
MPTGGVVSDHLRIHTTESAAIATSLFLTGGIQPDPEHRL